MKALFKDNMFEGRTGYIIKDEHQRFSFVAGELDSSQPKTTPEIEKWPHILTIKFKDGPNTNMIKLMLSEEMVNSLDVGDLIRSDYYYTYRKMDGAMNDIRYAIEKCSVKFEN